MEFKGTKGRWALEMSNGNPSVIDAEGYCLVDFFGLNEKDTYDALLISKAPELLDALQEIVCAFENNALKDVTFAKKLIQEATEI